MVELVPTESIEPSTYNPRKSDTQRLDLLELSLRKLGFLLPIYALPTGEIVSGHQRHLVAQRMGWKRVPVSPLRAMDLADRKALNIMFNRGTNDMEEADTCGTVTKALLEADVARLADPVPDVADRYPCMAAETVDLAPFLRDTPAPQHSRNLARALHGKGVIMPLVATRDHALVNGSGRVRHLAERGIKTAEVVWITDDQAALARATLNLLSMDFNLEERYADLLRHNSFRRARLTHTSLGRGFIFALIGSRASNTFDIAAPINARRWKGHFGSTVVDFGAGHLQETEMLRGIGVDVTPFEPYRLGAGEQVDKKASATLSRAFLRDVASGKRFDSVFISNVLNSVPFVADRRCIARICAALCDEDTRLYALAMSTGKHSARRITGARFLNETDSKKMSFALDYEPYIRLGDFGGKPKVQKYHQPREFYELFKTVFDVVRVDEMCGNVQAICSGPLPLDPAKLREALEFEFDLPYPDGSRMAMVPQALEAFSKRIGVAL